MIDGTPSLNMSHATTSGVTRYAMSGATFSNVTVYTNRATSCGVTQLLVVPRSLTQQKGLVLENIVWDGLFLNFSLKRVKNKKFKAAG
jgi:hypothetical protein